VGEGEAFEDDFAFRAALEKKFAPVGYDYHFGRAPAADGQGLNVLNSADVVATQDLVQLL